MFWWDKHILNCFLWFLVCFVKCIQSTQPSFYYLGEYEYRDVKLFLESEKRCKFHPLAKYPDYFTAKTNAEEIPCKILLQNLRPYHNWYEVSGHHVQYYGYGAKHTLNFTKVKCSSKGYKEIGMLILCEDQTANKKLYGECAVDDQCSGTPNAAVCKQIDHRKLCWCNNGYVPDQLSLKCRKVNKKLYEECKVDNQCSGTPNAAVCKKIDYRKLCLCNKGYIADHQSLKCRKDKRHLRESCEAHVQCSGTENANVCGKNKTCICNNNFIRIKKHCLPGNLSLGQTCQQDIQCTGTRNGMRCLHGECFCEKKFVQQRLKCLQGNLSLGQPCTHNVQCTGTEHGEKCLNGKCFCAEEFVPHKDTCIHVPNKTMDNCIGKSNWVFASACVGVCGTFVIYSAVLLVLKRRKSGKKRLNDCNARKETIRNIHYSLAEGIDLRSVPSQDFSENYYTIDDIYSEHYQKEKERKSENVYDASEPQSSYREGGSETNVYAYNHLREKPMGMAESIYDDPNVIPLSSFST